MTVAEAVVTAVVDVVVAGTCCCCVVEPMARGMMVVITFPLCLSEALPVRLANQIVHDKIRGMVVAVVGIQQSQAQGVSQSPGRSRSCCATDRTAAEPGLGANTRGTGTPSSNIPIKT